MWRAITKFKGKTTGKFWKTAVFFQMSSSGHMNWVGPIFCGSRGLSFRLRCRLVGASAFRTLRSPIFPWSHT